MKKYIVKIFDGLEFSDATLIFTNKGAKCELEFIFKNENIIVENDFPFLALVEIRKELEKLGIKILCNGSRVNVYPSGMGLNTLKAYELKMGEPARKLVNIFEATEDIDKIATISEQKLFWENFLQRGNVSK
jgi:hypothetical protein